ncbi:ribonuclease H-like domain-containing protein [Tanacetum coccineum]
MTDYSLWEVIKNGNKVLRRTFGTVEHVYEPTIAEEKQDRRNEMKARATLLMALPKKDQLKVHSYQDAKFLMNAIEKSQPNSPQLSQEDLEQLHPDDLEEMDLQWEMTMLTIRARRFIKSTGKKLDINGQRVGFDKSKVECFNCHKHGNFARECRFPRNQEIKGRENNTRTIAVETPTQNVLIAQDGIGGYDWSYQAEEEQPTNHALMAFTSSGSSSSSNSESGSDKGYYSIPPPLTGNFIPPKPDLTFMDEIVESENFDVTTVVTPCNVKTVENKGVSNTVESNVVRMNNTSAPIIEDWNSDDESETDYTGNLQQKEYKEKRFIDSGCSRHMTGNKCYLDEYKDYDGGFVSFGDGKGRISGKEQLSFTDTWNVLSLSLKKNNVLFTDTKCLVLSSDFKILDESQVLLRVPRKDNIYNVDLKSVVPNLWHRRLGHINFKNMNKLVIGNLVRGNQTNGIAGTRDYIVIGPKDREEEIWNEADRSG